MPVELLYCPVNDHNAVKWSVRLQTPHTLLSLNPSTLPPFHSPALLSCHKASMLAGLQHPLLSPSQLLPASPSNSNSSCTSLPQRSSPKSLARSDQCLLFVCLGFFFWDSFFYIALAVLELTPQVTPWPQRSACLCFFFLSARAKGTHQIILCLGLCNTKLWPQYVVIIFYCYFLILVLTSQTPGKRRSFLFEPTILTSKFSTMLGT